MHYREPLPEQCPPETAEDIVSSREVFRLVRSNPPIEEDLRSQRAEKPWRSFEGISECQARGLSVFVERKESEEALKIPSLRGRLVCRVGLDAGAGRLQQTGRASHYTWWPLADFDILPHCTVENP